LINMCIIKNYQTLEWIVFLL